MKKFILAALFLPLLACAQNIYTVSNVPGANANFKTLQGAHDTVPAGSTLYVLPSSFPYGDVVFTKRLTVYGTGYFLGQNLEPNTQANTSPVYVNSITFRAGSDNSFVEGLQLAFNNTSANEQRIVLDTVSNVTISRCLIVSNSYGAYGGYNNFFILAGANNCLIKQCYILANNGYDPAPVMVYPGGTFPNFAGIQFVNNIFDWTALGGSGFRIGPDALDYGGGGGFKSGGTADVKFINNTFIIDMKYAQFGNMNFTNNIFENTNNADIINPAALYLNGTNLYNITNAPNLFSALGNNIQNVNDSSLFVSTLPGFHSIDQKWMLRDTSFANTFGQGGIACGAFGGASPYKLSGIPNIPFIYSLSVPSQATAPGTISVHIKAHASN